MKIEKGFSNVRRFAAFRNPFVRYSRGMIYSMNPNCYGWEYGSYLIQLQFPFTKLNIKIYKGKTRPVFRNINLIAALWLISLPLLAAAALVCAAVYQLILFYKVRFFGELRYMSFTEVLSGVLSLVLSIFGLLTVINLLL